MAEHSISADTIEQIGYALGEIASLATVINRNSIQSTQELNESKHNQLLLESLILSNEHLAAQIGYIADLCSAKIGGIETLGGAERWLLPPAYNVLQAAT